MGYDYDKKSIWKWILLYVVIGAIACGAIYYFFFYKNSDYAIQTGQGISQEQVDNFVRTTADFQNYLSLAQSTVDELGKGNINYLKENFSQISIEANSSVDMDSFFLQVKQFFNDFYRRGNYLQIVPSVNPDGNNGYAFTMNIVYKNNNEKNLKIYIVKENNKLVVANLILDVNSDGTSK